MWADCRNGGARHPSSVSALRADPPSPTRGEGRTWRRRLCQLPASAMGCEAGPVSPSPVVGEGGREADG
ncbi:hypothetical protein EN751_26080 [Mesorhizobium sp. M4A.F.Ca.ET.029.04.2.1]|nr:hypothetical protein EN751_26080 [Mesorhizobium sp. M4A.F.Ca.ET.029.04.2.1]